MISSGDRFGFTGKERDEFGLHYFVARYYDSSVGRFLSVDPVKDNHAYVYVHNNPLNFVDPDGRDPRNNPFNRNIWTNYWPYFGLYTQDIITPVGDIPIIHDWVYDPGEPESLFLGGEITLNTGVQNYRFFWRGPEEGTGSMPVRYGFEIAFCLDCPTDDPFSFYIIAAARGIDDQGRVSSFGSPSSPFLIRLLPLEEGGYYEFAPDSRIIRHGEVDYNQLIPGIPVNVEIRLDY